MTTKVIVVGRVGSQQAFGAGLTAVPDLVKPADSHGEGLEEFLNDVVVRVVEVPSQFGSSENCQVLHTIDEKLGCWVSTSVFRKLDVEYNLRINVDRYIQPDLLAPFKFDLFLIDSDAVWLGCELLVVVLSIGLVLVPDRLPGSIDTEPGKQVTTFRQRYRQSVVYSVEQRTDSSISTDMEAKMSRLRRDVSHESAFRPAERLRHWQLLAHDIKERSCRHAWFQPLFNVETDLYQ